MADEEQRRHSTDDATGAQPRRAPYDNTRSRPDDKETLVGDNDLAMRGVGVAGESAGTGVPGLGGATRPAASTSDSAPSTLTAQERTMERADRSALRTEPMMSTTSGGAAGSDIPNDRDEAATRARGDAGAQSMPMPPGPDAPVPDAPQYDVNSPIWNAATPSTPEHPVPEEPLPGVIERPGPEAET